MVYVPLIRPKELDPEEEEALAKAAEEESKKAKKGKNLKKVLKSA